jgi:putative tricarboxylic transport membrane protein
MADALRSTGLVQNVVIEYSPGAGGMIGLAQFLSSNRGRTDTLLVGGGFMLGSAIQNHAAVSLLDTTPLARLTFDNAVVAVSAGSSFKSAEDLIEAMLATPQSITWVGGSRGGVDEINLHEIARALGLSASKLYYTGLPGGGAVGAALAEDSYMVGISGYSEFEELVHTGKLRILAILADEGLAGVPAPSFAELGIKTETRNWRGAFAAPGISKQQTMELYSLIEKMVATPEWSQLLTRNHWLPAYLDGDEFVDFLKTEEVRVANELRLMRAADPSDVGVINSVLFRRYAWAITLSILSVLLLVGLFYQRILSQRREEGLQQAYEQATGKANLHTEELERALTNIQDNIAEEFDRWGLTAAEREIALFLLKGLRLKDIAESRGTSERTVRQQAQAIYKKAGLDGRFELAAYFIEDVIQSMELGGATPTTTT